MSGSWSSEVGSVSRNTLSYADIIKPAIERVDMAA
jgi:hypothetical protein